jgi:hypothetical protein
MGKKGQLNSIIQRILKSHLLLAQEPVVRFRGLSTTEFFLALDRNRAFLEGDFWAGVVAVVCAASSKRGLFFGRMCRKSEVSGQGWLTTGEDFSAAADSSRLRVLGFPRPFGVSDVLWFGGTTAGLLAGDTVLQEV